MKPLDEVLPRQRGLYYGGAWHEPRGGYAATFDPGTGQSLGAAAQADAADVDAAVCAAGRGFETWRRVKPQDRTAPLRRIAAIIRENAEELALIDAANCGNPVTRMAVDMELAAEAVDYFAGLATQLKGETLPMGEDILNYSVREPIGVCARIVAYNHPLMFLASRLAAPIAAGNSVIMKPPVQAPLSSYRLMELIDGVLPPGVLNVLSGGTECGQALVAHPQVPRLSLIGSVTTGRAIARAAADRLKHATFELGGKNALVVYPDADIARAVEGAVKGMNFAWCGQSCGSTSRLFLHESVHDEVLEGVVQAVRVFRPGLPTDPATTMGALISEVQWERVMEFIEAGRREGARLITGGGRPQDPALARGWFIEPTIFADVTMQMRIAREEIFGPVLSVLRWSDEEDLFRQVNDVEYGLTASVYTRDLARAHRAASRIEAGFLWVNNAGPHFTGASYGGLKQSGNAREESFEELLSFTQTRNVNVTL